MRWNYAISLDRFGEDDRRLDGMDTCTVISQGMIIPASYLIQLILCAAGASGIQFSISKTVDSRQWRA